MLNLNDLSKMAYDNASKREAKDGKVSTDTMQMLKHTATEVVEATEAFHNYFLFDNEFTDHKGVFASELADIICCVLIIAGKEKIDMEKALTECMEKNYFRAIGKGDK